ncbi:MAG: 30S ribosomal protein S3 [Candidatus Kapaibacteriota bacterium]
MGQKTNPVGLRLGITRGWDANWFDDRNYADKLTEDIKVRNYIRNRKKGSGISRIVIDRTAKQLRITIHTAKPGMIIGKSGKDITQLEYELKKVTNKEVKIYINEIKRPELDAFLVGEGIAAQLEKRVSFRRAMKQAVSAAMRMGAIGIKVMCSGRLGGAEMARTEQYKEGRTPLHTLRADIDYASQRAETIYGTIGIKVWIFKGEVY